MNIYEPRENDPEERESPIHDPPPMKLFSIYSWFSVILRGYFNDATLFVG